MPIYKDKKVFAFDLDGTLALSKSKISKDMALAIDKLLSRYFVAVISGGAYPQFQNQFIYGLNINKEKLKNLSLFPMMGTTCYRYDFTTETWKQIYNEKLQDSDRQEIVKALHESIILSGVELGESYGEVIEDRGNQITFSAKGQSAPVDIKKCWDADHSKRQKIIDILNTKITNFNISIGGMTSIDITPKGLDKSYAIEKVKELLQVNDDEIVFVGDALYSGGNDSPIKKTGVDFIQQNGPEETLEFLSDYI